MKNNLISILIVAVVVGAVCFFAGMQYQRSQRQAFGGQFAANGQRAGNTGQFQGVTNRAGGLRPVNGEIVASDNNSITVKLQDGSSKIILVDSKTQINKAATATKSDLKNGEKVVVFGQENSDGTVTAQSIQLNPQLRNGGNATPPAK
jgi:subtilase family serine protease